MPWLLRCVTTHADQATISSTPTMTRLMDSRRRRLATRTARGVSSRRGSGSLTHLLASFLSQRPRETPPARLRPYCAVTCDVCA